MVKSSTGSPGVRTCGAHHPGVCGLDSDFGVIMGTVDVCPPCKVKSDRFAVTRGYESLGHCVAL